MVLVILACGSLYTFLGGPVPLASLDMKVAGLLLLLMLSMQGMNDGIMACMMYLRKSDPNLMLNLFSIGIELASVPKIVQRSVIY